MREREFVPLPRSKTTVAEYLQIVTRRFGEGCRIARDFMRFVR